MPSLHAGTAALVAFFAISRLRSPWRFAFLLYPVAMGFMLVYYGEHYVVDIVAGYLLAGFIMWACANWERGGALRRGTIAANRAILATDRAARRRPTRLRASSAGCAGSPRRRAERAGASSSIVVGDGQAVRRDPGRAAGARLRRLGLGPRLVAAGAARAAGPDRVPCRDARSPCLPAHPWLLTTAACAPPALPAIAGDLSFSLGYNDKYPAIRGRLRRPGRRAAGSGRRCRSTPSCQRQIRRRSRA